MMDEHTGYTAQEISVHGTPNSLDIEKMIIEYAKEKCKEQRELCAEGFLNTGDPAGHEILDTPEPKFE